MTPLNKVIRRLNKEDFSYYQQVQTNLERDYIAHIFPELTTGANHLFGLFIDDQLVSTAGYTVYAKQYAMLGRLRSDVRFRGKSYGTEILRYAKEQALMDPSVKWIGSNTEEHNIPAQKVLNKIALPPIITLYGAQAESVRSLTSGAKTWHKLDSTNKKWEWLEKTYLDPTFGKEIFPYKSYYPFPVTKALFENTNLKEWTFYENEDLTRYVILWEEETDKPYLHVTYPWDDFQNENGLWETICQVQEDLEGKPYIWIDLTKEEADHLPNGHPFELPSPWMLHGQWKNPLEQKNHAITEQIKEVSESVSDLEKELKELESNITENSEQTKELLSRIDDLKQ